jgi:hypothetical protein
MKECTITVDVYANSGDHAPRYRVYVNNDLLTERDFIWPSHEVYVQENIIVNLTTGKHTLKVEQVGTQGSIRPKNVTVDGVASSFEFTVVE